MDTENQRQCRRDDARLTESGNARSEQLITRGAYRVAIQQSLACLSGSERRRPGWFLDMKYQTCLAADAFLSCSLPSITEQQVSPHRLPMQYWLKNHRLSSNIPRTPTILRNNYISLLSDLCACVHVKKKWGCDGSHSSSVGGSNRLM